jgi:hypothetical protein
MIRNDPLPERPATRPCMVSSMSSSAWRSEKLPSRRIQASSVPPT